MHPYDLWLGKPVRRLFMMILRVWFLASAAVAAFAAGWIAGSPLPGVIAVVAAIAAISLNKTRSIALVTLVSLGLASGGVTAARDGALNAWITGSIERLFPPDRTEEVLAIEYERLQELQIGPAAAGATFLIAFDNFGITVLRDGEAEILHPHKGVNAMYMGEGDIYAFYFDDGHGPVRKFRYDESSVEKVLDRNKYHVIHHFGDVLDGKLYIPGRSFADLPNDVSRRFEGFYDECEEVHTFRESINIYDADTLDFIESIDLFSAILRSPEFKKYAERTIDDCKDPIHLNAVHVIKNPEHARAFPDGKVGDMLVSLRDVHAVALIDRSEYDVKWFVSRDDVGFDMQHDPTITSDGTLLVFDNMGGDAPYGYSRVLEIDIETKTLRGAYEATSGSVFHSTYRGKVRKMSDGRYLVQAQDQIDDNDIFTEVSLFMLECPDETLSNDCMRHDVFRGHQDTFEYSNAIMLE